MTASRDPNRLIRAFLDEGPTDLPDRTYDAVRSHIDRTRQRAVIGPWREPRMSNLARLAIAAAAVVVVAVVGINLLPGRGGVGGPAVSPSPSPSPTPSPSPVPTPPTFAFPPAGDLAIGRHALTLSGIPFSLEVAVSGWNSNGDFAIDKGHFPATWAGGFIIWSNAADGIFTDPCRLVEGPPVGPSAADLADALATVPGTTATGPSDVTVGGYPAKLVVITIPEDPGCTAESFYLWWDSTTSGRYASVLGSTIRVWIIDVNGTLIQIDGETPPGASPALERELEQIVESIRFD
jgi:hypothetical protein